MNIYTVRNKKQEKFLRGKLPDFDLAKADKKELRKLVREMRVMMKAAAGIGLAANQIGRPERMFVAQIPRSRDSASDGKFYAVFNPRIVKKSKETVALEEGCLSVPDELGAVSRHERVMLEGQTIEGRKLKIKAWGLLARVFQHEVDHLDGFLFIDRLKK